MHKNNLTSWIMRHV